MGREVEVGVVVSLEGPVVSLMYEGDCKMEEALVSDTGCCAAGLGKCDCVVCHSA